LLGNISWEVSAISTCGKYFVVTYTNGYIHLYKEYTLQYEYKIKNLFISFTLLPNKNILFIRSDKGFDFLTCLNIRNGVTIFEKFISISATIKQILVLDTDRILLIVIVTDGSNKMQVRNIHTGDTEHNFVHAPYNNRISSVNLFENFIVCLHQEEIEFYDSYNYTLIYSMLLADNFLIKPSYIVLSENRLAVSNENKIIIYK
jgi:hypothetical protein